MLQFPRRKYAVLPSLVLCSVIASLLAGCGRSGPKQAGPAMQAMPVHTITVHAQPVPESDEYVATIKSRRAATINPQVSGNITRILVRSGQFVHHGQLLMDIDASKQEATVASQAAVAQQELAVYDYDRTEFHRQKKLYADGIVSRDAYEQAQQAFSSAKANYKSAMETLNMQKKELAYYHITAPFSGVVGDVPVHVGDYASTTTLLTTVDQNRDLEAYVYIPTERASQIQMGLPVEILDNSGQVLEKTAIDFVSPQVNDTLQGILVKAPVRNSSLRNLQLVEARVVWGTAPHPVVPVLAVSRLGGQAFVFIVESKNGKFVAHEQPITLGSTVGNDYSVLNGLKDGDEVIVSGTQFLADGMPVIPLPSSPRPAGTAHQGQ